MNKIKNLLADMRLVLCNNANDFESDFHISERGVPYVHVVVNQERYQFCYFGKKRFFRIWNSKQEKVADIEKRNDVIQFFRDLAGKS